MPRLSLKFFCVLFAIIISMVFIDRYFFGKKLTQFGPVIIKKPLSYLFVKFENTRFFFSNVVKIGDSVKEIESLKEENLKLISQVAEYEDTKEENSFLRKTLNLATRFNNKVTYAGVYQFQLGPNGYEVLINKGTNHGVSAGDTVISEDNVLIGGIKRSYDDFSRIMVVNDHDFKVAVKILSSGTAGIAKGAMSQGMYLDLIVSSDPIKEGDVVVSTGIDFFPPSLVVGVVSHVEANEADVFKKVKIRPAIGEIKIGRVLIIKN